MKEDKAAMQLIDGVNEMKWMEYRMGKGAPGGDGGGRGAKDKET